ncbi:MAG: CehA/McbA family metallohydrolase [Phaeodactylibacter sp.]|nr:CehA/McbA family metallohydrolase [Phaeodactylibacter sp.]
MRNFPAFFLPILLIVLGHSALHAHPGHTDPVLEELNDYLMAIQIMRADDPRATAIFETWRELRAASWKIRELTDEQGLLIDDEKARAQISATRAKREQLLRECRAYFADLMREEPALRFSIDDAIQVEWGDPLLEVQAQHAKVILIEVRNRSGREARLSINADRSDNILFWNKHFNLAPQASRYTFVVCSPLAPEVSASSIRLTDSLGRQAEAVVRMQGIPMTTQPYRLLPGEYLSQAKLPDTTGLPVQPQAPFDQFIQFNIKDKETGKPLAARIEVEDEEGAFYWYPLQGPAYGMSRASGGKTPLWEYQPGPYFYAKGQVSLGVGPAGKTVRAYRGFEYLPFSADVPENGVVEIVMERWIDMPARGWYGGQTHIHTTDAGMPVQFSRHWPLVSEGEGLHVSAILTLKGEWQTHAIYANEFPMGKREAFSSADHLIVYGEEFRNNPYGHLALIGLAHLVQPISTGALGELGGPDYPPNAHVLDEALEQGAVTIAAHFGNFTRGVGQVKTPWPSTGFEMPVDIALGKLQVAEIYGNGGQLDVWYDILNCGFRIPATAGPDWAIKDSPRVYAHLGDQEFTLENWTTGLRRGNSFITRGPMLFFSVNGQLAGSEISLSKRAADVRVEANALSPIGEERVELVYNGNVIGSGAALDTLVTLNDSGWLAARCEGAHSNPVYIHFEGRPAGMAAPARKFIRIIDRLEEWVQQKGLFDHEGQKQEVLAVISQGRKVYEDIARRAEELGRE